MTLDDLERYYRALDLESGASQEQIRRAWRDLTKVWHPDRFQGDPQLAAKAEERLKAINEAYQHLTEPEASPHQEPRSKVAATDRQARKRSSSAPGSGDPPPSTGHSAATAESAPAPVSSSPSRRAQQGTVVGVVLLILNGLIFVPLVSAHSPTAIEALTRTLLQLGAASFLVCTVIQRLRPHRLVIIGSVILCAQVVLAMAAISGAPPRVLRGSSSADVPTTGPAAVKETGSGPQPGLPERPTAAAAPVTADEWYRAGLEKAKSNATPRRGLAEAVPAYLEAIRLDPSLVSAWYDLGWAYSQLGRDHQALDAYRRALKLNENVDFAWFAWKDMGDIYARLGHRKDAVVCYKRSLQLRPGETWVQAALAAVEGAVVDTAAQEARAVKSQRGLVVKTVTPADIAPAECGFGRRACGAAKEEGVPEGSLKPEELAKQCERIRASQKYADAAECYGRARRLAPNDAAVKQACRELAAWKAGTGCDF